MKSKSLKNALASMLAIHCLPLAAPASAAPLVLPPADIFYTSFESNETPAYNTGTLIGQNGWVGSTTSPYQIVANNVTPGTPDGSQMVKITGSNAITSLTYASPALMGDLYFSALAAFNVSTVNLADTLISRMYLNNSSANFNGAGFGIRQVNSQYEFYYLSSTNVATSFGSINASADTFYRFEADVDIDARKYVLRVYDYQTNVLLASASDLAFRNGGPDSFNYLRLQNVSVDFSSYYDQVWLSTTPVPEPSTMAFLIGGGLLLIGGRRFLRRSLSRTGEIFR